MQVKRSDLYNKVRYAGFDGDHRVTQWLPSPQDVENQFVGRVREGRVDPRGMDSRMRESITQELDALGFRRPNIEEGLSSAEQLAFTLQAMREQGIPQETRARFAQIATCTPESDTRWALYY